MDAVTVLVVFSLVGVVVFATIISKPTKKSVKKSMEQAIEDDDTLEMPAPPEEIEELSLSDLIPPKVNYLIRNPRRRRITIHKKKEVSACFRTISQRFSM